MRLCWDLMADGCWYATAPDTSIWCWSKDNSVREITGKHNQVSSSPQHATRIH